MYSEEKTSTRFSAASSDEQLACVSLLKDKTWAHRRCCETEEPNLRFDVRPSDLLLAKISVDSGALKLLNGVAEWVHGIRAGNTNSLIHDTNGLIHDTNSLIHDTNCPIFLKTRGMAWRSNGRNIPGWESGSLSIEAARPYDTQTRVGTVPKGLVRSKPSMNLLAQFWPSMLGT